MNTEEKNEMKALRAEIDRLMAVNADLAAVTQQMLTLNIDLYERLDLYYNVRMHVDWLKDLLKRHREMMATADLRDDTELLSVIEARIEGDNIPLPPEFGAREVAELVGVTQSRVIDLYKKKTIYHSLDKYLDYLRLMRALRMLKEHPEYNIEAIALESGFASVRTLNRKIQEQLGLTPGEFRVITHPEE